MPVSWQRLPLFPAASGSSVSGTERIEDSGRIFPMVEDGSDVKTQDPVLHECYGMVFGLYSIFSMLILTVISFTSSYSSSESPGKVGTCMSRRSPSNVVSELSIVVSFVYIRTFSFLFHFSHLVWIVYWYR